MLRRSTPVCLLLSALLCGAAARAEEWLPRFAPEPGIKYRLEMLTRQNGTMESEAFPGTDLAMSNRMEISQWLLGEDADGNSRVAFVYERMVVETDMGGSQVVIDTAEPAGEAMGEAWAQMIGREMVIRLSPQGDVLEIEKLDEILQGVFADLPDDAQTQGLKQLMSQSFGGEQLRQMMQMSTAVYPDQPVGVGDAWERELEMNNPAMGKVLVNNRYLATGVEDGPLGRCLAADVSTEMEFESGGMLDQLSEIFRQQGAEVSMAMDIDVSSARGDICIDLDTGLVGRMTQELEFVMDMTMDIQSADVSQNLEMTMTMDVVTQLEVTDTEPLP